jgi:CxxC-x17-CxxC domain-containing protein
MFNKPFRGKKGGDFKAGKRFGGGAGNRDRRGTGGSDWKPMHDATCAGCGSRCQVPFRPNGSKPVYCSQCFGNEGGSSHKRFDRPRDERSSPDRSNGMSDQLKEINGKLDAILRALDV